MAGTGRFVFGRTIPRLVAAAAARLVDVTKTIPSRCFPGNTRSHGQVMIDGDGAWFRNNAGK